MTVTASFDFSAVETIANAVLYEGFLLYPYRKSSLKNQRGPRLGALSPGTGAMQTMCLLEGDEETIIAGKVRFLQEETEREILLPEWQPMQGTSEHEFRFGRLLVNVEIGSEVLRKGLLSTTVKVLNLGEAGCDMLCAHTLLALRKGRFISLTDPGAELQADAARCQNVGTWPVLIGRAGEQNFILSSPIILPDYPQIAPESATNFFDGTEIDEMLSLRVMTLTAAEREELRAGGGHGSEILQRTEELSAESFAKLHGALQPAFRAGDRVRLRPQKRADIFDIVLSGKIAIVESVERDFENKIHLAVTLSDDPGRDLGVAGFLGHRFFFAPDEVERL